MLLISSQIDRIAGFLTFGVDTILGGASDLVAGLSAIKSSQAGVAPAVRNRAEQLRDQLMANIEKLSESPDRFPPQDELINSMLRLAVQCVLIRSDENLADLASQELARKKQRIVSAYNKSSTNFIKPTSPRTGGDPSFLGNEAVPAGYAQAFVHKGDTLKTLAKRLLGSAQRWQILALANNLKAPYIGPVSKAGVLAPGDAILYPEENTPVRGNSVTANSNASAEVREGSDTSASGPVIDSYGKDVRLRSRS